MKWNILCFFFLTPLLFCQCTKETEGLDENLIFTFTQADSTHWTVDFVDYPLQSGDDYDMEFKFTHLPSPLDSTASALMISGANHSVDLYMYAKRKIAGLQPNTTYRLDFSASFATDVASNAVGIGGAPGESVLIKAGATTLEPVAIHDTDGMVRLSADKGNQSNIGSDAVLLGDGANGTDTFEYVMQNRRGDRTLTVTTDDQGELWLFIGSDSSYEGATTLYYTGLTVTFTQRL